MLLEVMGLGLVWQAGAIAWGTYCGKIPACPKFESMDKRMASYSKP